MNENDWNLLNLYADGEMDPSDAAAFARRIDNDPALQAGLANLVETKALIREMYSNEETPDLTQAKSALRQNPAMERTDGQRINSHALTFAAGVACAIMIFVGVQLFSVQSDPWPAQIVSIHDTLSDKSYAVDKHNQVKLVPGRRFSALTVPDLTFSALYFVGLVDQPDYLALHYRGMNGCSLTVVARERTGTRAYSTKPVSSDRLLMEAWQGKEYDYAVISEGMDKGRFYSVYEFMKAEFQHQQERRNELRIAMKDAYESAAPCA